MAGNPGTLARARDPGHRLAEGRAAAATREGKAARGGGWEPRIRHRSREREPAGDVNAGGVATASPPK